MLNHIVKIKLIVVLISLMLIISCDNDTTKPEGYCVAYAEENTPGDLTITGYQY